MRVFHDVKVGLDEELEEHLSWMAPGYSQYRVLKESVDARQRHSAHFVYSVEVYDQGETPSKPEFIVEKIGGGKTVSAYKGPKPLIIGAGPAGLFAALRFVERGVPCILFERGSESIARMKGINRFWRYGELDHRNNVCYGEGGAGLYSDGKLITRIKSPYISYVMNRLVQFGAPPEIEYIANPHVGSDRIRRVIPKMREFLIANGCEIHFDTQIKKILTERDSSSAMYATSTVISQIPRAKIIGVETEHGTKFMSDKVILAAGHSAEDMIQHLEDIGVLMEGKSFAVGLRIEHPQSEINKIQYRDAADHPKLIEHNLGSANYKLAHHDKKTDIGVYSFCMCPGGYVLSSGTETDGIVCNGMSNYRRNSPFANSAVVVTVDHAKTFGNDRWGGMKFRREIEQKAFQMVRDAGGTKEIPAQKLTDFMAGRAGDALPSSSPSDVKAVRLDQVLPKSMTQSLRNGLEVFGGNMRGFLSDEAQLHGVESRTSCPIRITRDKDTLQSLSHSGLYPCGEGAGYAGGITSAACDGIKIVEKILGLE